MLVFVALIGVSSGMAGMSGFWFLFAMAIILSVAANTAHGAEQGLIPDLAPEDKRGRFSGVKAVLEVPLPMILVSFTIAKLIAAGNLWGGLLLAMAVLVVVMLLTMLVPEKRLAQAPGRFDWTPILRLALMTALFTAIILGMGEGVKLLGRALGGVTSAATLLPLAGVAGLLAMALTVAIGVWISVRISIGGQAAAANPSFTWWVVNRLAFLVGTTNLSTFAVYFLQGRLGLVREKAAGPAALLMTVIGVFILLSALPSGWLADKFGHKRLVAIAGIMAAVWGGDRALGAEHDRDLCRRHLHRPRRPGCSSRPTGRWAPSWCPQAEAGRYLGISNLAGAGAGAVGAYIGGPLADFLTAQLPGLPGAGYILLFAIFGVMFLLSVVALRWIKTPAPNSTP